MKHPAGPPMTLGNMRDLGAREPARIVPNPTRGRHQAVIGAMIMPTVIRR
jgi:hypothetical protein